ncbi:SUR7/PalI family-domain-containing protein [Aspergillus coremiiformis]|uniref:SUR7/PalI family-domain-containing protein n=1 Tax=Aspergillus coremiiformis TaxID=138285 RepID=A0A5N6ZG99_9EURO|nr:SUR7/PalI family-domain-containing protein [Aspergillus coremiiformis]
MLLKPATPLTILLLVAFILLLLSVISTPIITGIPLATFENVDYGVFGYCKSGQCTDIHIGYTIDDLSNTADDFNLPSTTRRSLSSILIVHPVAAFLTLICLCMAAAAHFHAPSHSPRYLLALLILLLPTLLVSLLAFLVDILLFVPHLGWGGWIVLGATILLVSCGVVTCAMRRTLVSRKARKKRIAENAEMSGENFYNRQNAAAAAAGLSDPKPLNGEAKEPFVTGSLPGSDTGPTFATFRTTTHESDDDRTPLNSRTPPNGASLPDRRYPTQVRNNGPPYNSSRDELGNPLPPPGPHGPGPRMRPGPGDPALHNQYSDGSMASRTGPPPPGFVPRGRGGYPVRGGYGRGTPYGGPRGPPPGGRGGAMGSVRGGRGGYRGPVPFGHGPNPGPRPMPPPEGHASPGPMRQLTPGPIGTAGLPPNPGPIGQAIEMTPQSKQTGSTEPAPQEVLLSAQQPHAVSADGYPEPVSPTSLYSRTPSYVPPHATWEEAEHLPGHSNTPVHAYGTAETARTPHHGRSGAADYFEDVDPRFANRNEPAVANPRLPSALTPGGSGEPKPTGDLAEGLSSPTTSDISHFTSISERPINPRWQPPPGPAQQKRNVLLENNPDFDLRAGMRGAGAGAGLGGRMPPISIPRETSRYPLP